MKLGLIQVKVAIINSLRNCRVLIGPNTPIPMPINNEKMAYAPKVGVHLKVEMLWKIWIVIIHECTFRKKSRFEFDFSGKKIENSVDSFK